jgi:hypothetical protein
VSRVATCQQAYFQTKNPYLVYFGGSCNGRCWYIEWTSGIFWGHLIYLVYYIVIWYIFMRFGMSHQEKSGSLANKTKNNLSMISWSTS